MKLFCLDTAFTAVGYYRQRAFADRMREMGHQVIVSNFLTDGFLYDSEIVHIVGINPNAIDVNTVKQLQKQGRKVVMDCDDAVFHIGPHHPDKDRNLMWSVTYKDHLRGMLETVDSIFVTNAAMKNYLVAYTGKPVYIVPNCLDERIHNGIFKPQARLPSPTVLWAGGSTHIMDMDMIKDVFFELGSKGTRFRFIGSYPPHVAGTNFVDYIEWSQDIQTYYQSLALAIPDICIAPLQDTQFNSCKSNVKLLEYSAYCGVPTIASDIGPYHSGYMDDTKLVKNDFHKWVSTIRNALADRSGERVYRIPDDLKLENVVTVFVEALSKTLDRNPTPPYLPPR